MGTQSCQPSLAHAGASGEPLDQMFAAKTAVAVLGRVASSPPPPHPTPPHPTTPPAAGAQGPRVLSPTAAAGHRAGAGQHPRPPPGLSGSCGAGPGAAPRPDGRLASCVQGGSARTTSVASRHPATLSSQRGDVGGGGGGLGGRGMGSSQVPFQGLLGQPLLGSGGVGTGHLTQAFPPERHRVGGPPQQ